MNPIVIEIKTAEQLRAENLAKIEGFKLMHDFKCSQPSEMYYHNLAERASYLKDTKEGYDDMCQIMEESNKEAMKQQIYQIAMKLIRKVIVDFEDIAEVTDLTLEDVKELAEIV